MGYVFVHMNAPRPDGFSSKEEFDTLAAIEDALERGLCAGPSTRYVGRNTSAGRRDFSYYTSRDSGWEGRVAAVMQSFPAYDVDCGARSDPEWETYFRFLHPSPVDHHRIMNRRVCFNLEKHGDALSKEREIDHWVYFPNAGARSAFVARAVELGFRWREDGNPQKAGDDFGVHLTRVDVPSYQAIDIVTMRLFDLAEEFGGRYDGWGCGVVS
jgi:Regulator of ribonuclease activity B/Family of unknown function (DUF695)